MYFSCDSHEDFCLTCVLYTTQKMTGSLGARVCLCKPLNRDAIVGFTVVTVGLICSIIRHRLLQKIKLQLVALRVPIDDNRHVNMYIVCKDRLHGIIKGRLLMS